jgi:hypothetical protein
MLLLAYIIPREARKRTNKQEALLAEAAAPAALRLRIASTRTEGQPWLNGSLLKSHAVPLKFVRDVAWYELKHETQLPDDVAGCLASCYKAGLARGVKARDLVVFGKGRPGDKVVFALVDAGGEARIVIMALVA